MHELFQPNIRAPGLYCLPSCNTMPFPFTLSISSPISLPDDMSDSERKWSPSGHIFHRFPQSPGSYFFSLSLSPRKRLSRGLHSLTLFHSHRLPYNYLVGCVLAVSMDHLIRVNDHYIQNWGWDGVQWMMTCLTGMCFGMLFAAI